MSVTEYVVGFAHDKYREIAFIKKTHPDWQAGKLNGVGGKVEENETPMNAMVREFEEETGQYEENWNLVVILEYPDDEVRIYFYECEISPFTMTELKSPNDEQIMVIQANALPFFDHVANLSWIVPLAMYTEVNYYPTIRVSASRRDDERMYHE